MNRIRIFCLNVLSGVLLVSLSVFCLADTVFAQEPHTGYASWYGPGFHARLTANGEHYDMYGLTAAHREWAFGTLVEVYNRDNKRKCIVRVNDRGPVSKSFLMDLSYGASMAISSSKVGKARVFLTIVGNSDGVFDKERSFYLFLDDEIVLPQKLDVDDLAQDEEYYRNIAGGIEIFQLTQKHIRRLYQANIVNAPNLLVSIGNKICLGPYETFKEAELDYHKIATQYVHAALWLEKTDKAIRLVTE
ncbi:MAG: septal ring lytic transglycosylase RlpA family protein [Mailhella sp.]|nr:septal ring lytic transglycosylase RlpA family protein [Mailhella sp.]